jgi:hypothetical protein
MINDTLTKIENKINSAKNINEEKKKELLRLISILKREMLEVSKTDIEHAQSIANFVNASAHEAMKEIVDPHMFELASQGLSASVRKFEVTHPDLVSVVNALSTLLAGMGI